MVFICETKAQSSQEADADLRKAESFRKNAQSDSAIFYYERVAASFEKTSSKEANINALNQAGALLTRQDKLERAEILLNKALSLGRQLADSNDLNIATTCITLGVVYNAKGEYEKSLKFHHRALSIRMKKLGEEHAETATSFGNIGNVYLNAKDPDQALQNHLKALNIRERLFGPTGLELAQSYGHIGNVYKAKNEPKPAIENYLKAVEIKKAKLGEDHKDLQKLYSQISEQFALLKDKENTELYKKKSETLNKK